MQRRRQHVCDLAPTKEVTVPPDKNRSSEPAPRHSLAVFLRQPAFSPKTAPFVVSKPALRKGERDRPGRTRRRPADGIRLAYRSLSDEFDSHNAKVLGFLRHSSEATGVLTRKPQTTCDRQAHA